MLRENHNNFRTVKKQLTTKQNIREKQKFVLCNLLQNQDFLILTNLSLTFPKKCCLARSENGRFQKFLHKGKIDVRRKL